MELANNAKLAYQNMVEEYEKDECENLIEQSKTYSRTNLTTINDCNSDVYGKANGVIFNNSVITNPRIPSHMGHSRNASNGSNISIEPFGYHINYHTHSRSASGTFNYGHTTTSLGGHSRSASNGAQGINLDLVGGLHSNIHWTHTRTPSNCSNISVISRLSEPVSEIGGSNLMLNATNASINSANTSAHAAVQFYNDQVRQELRESESSSTVIASDKIDIPVSSSDEQTQNDAGKDNISSSLVNLHLGCINELDAGNEVDTEDAAETAQEVDSESVSKA